MIRAHVPLTGLLAQAAGGGAPESTLDILRQGLEWPAYFIIAGSFVAIALIVEHFLTVRAATILPPAQVQRTRQFIETRRFRECRDLLRDSSTFFAQVMSAALRHARHGFEAMHEAALEKSGELSGRMFRKVEYLNILGNLGPLMGLTGTVWGMIIAFHELSASGAGAERLSRGISLALVNTLLGLLLAVVGLGFFGLCRNRIDALTVRATVQVLDLLEYFRPVTGRPPAAPGESAPRSGALPSAAALTPDEPAG